MRKIVGMHTCREAMSLYPDRVRQLWVKKNYMSNKELDAWVSWAKKKRIPVQTPSDAFFDQLASGHQGVCFEIAGRPRFDDTLLDKPGPLTLVVLDGVEDPHNLGAVLRSTWLLGAQAVFVPDRRSAKLTATVSRVSCGGSEHIPVEEVTNITQFLTGLKDKGFWVYGLDGGSKETLWAAEFPEKVVLVMGAEDKGVRPLVRKTCDQLLSIPQVTSQASLNVSVATACVLAEVRRQSFVSSGS